MADLRPGLEFETPGIVVTESHIVAFAGLAGDFFGLRMDDTFARAQGNDGPVAHGLLCLVLVDGLRNRAITQIDAIASLEWNWRFVAPVYPGDRIHARLEMLDARATSKPGRGVARLSIVALIQRCERVQEGVHVLLVCA